MKKLLIICISLFLFVHAEAAQLSYTKSDSIKVVALLKEAHHLQPGSNFMLHFARKLLDIPYVGQTLEQHSKEHLVVNLHQFDCTTYVETVTALTLCAKNRQVLFSDYCHHLQNIRYTKGLVSYPHRNHYFTQWIISNTENRLLHEICSPNPPFSARQRLNVNYMSTHPDKYPMLKGHAEWVRQIAQNEQELMGRYFPYIPKEKVDNSQLLRSTVHDGDIIAIVTNKKGLDIAHVGIAVWHPDGLHLLNASSIHKKTIEEPMTMTAYMSKHPSQIGLRIVRLSKQTET